MLSWRVATAAVLIPPLVAALFVLDSAWLAALLGLFAGAGAWEWAGLAGLKTARARVLYAVAVVAVGGVTILIAAQATVVARLTLGVAVAAWLWMAVELALWPAPSGGVLATCPGRAIGGFVVLVPPWLAAFELQAHDGRRPLLLLFVFVLVWVADTGAYAAGHVFGRTRLAPHISPGKTVEGALGGLGAAVLLAYVWGTMILGYRAAALVSWLGLAAVTTLFSVVGDLTESRLKRIAGVKDSGGLLPGHGGVLDRIDAFTAAAPVFALVWTTLFMVRT